jgi:hypothetical protein
VLARLTGMELQIAVNGDTFTFTATPKARSRRWLGASIELIDLLTNSKGD